ncbi:MAG TPA: ABC-F family ATP-binding cassette domain-containing protein [Chloroflexota bacterium]|nr:ABC-F family ATP-binding cassette domain-containing protein [Chloroflexota bacterium]
MRLHGVSKSYGVHQVLDDVSFAITAGERVALVGPNGAGKSTLLQIALGTLPPDEGQRLPQPGLTIGYLAQDTGVVGERTLWNELLAAFPELTALDAALREAADALAAPPAGQAELAALVQHQGRLQERFEQLDGYRVESQIGTVLAGLGFREDQRTQPVGTFSGGWQMRIALAKLLVRPPGLLLLDEPTNHLDLAAVEWLEEYLRAFPGAAIVVSHDRYFLDRVATRTLALERGKLTDYRGNYTYYQTERARRRQAQADAFARQQRALAQQYAFVERFRASATRSTQAKSRERLLERQERIAAPPPELDTIKLRFADSPPSEPITVSARGLRKGYDGRTVLDGLDLQLERGQRLALVGPNGAGKSTLLRLLAARERPDGGSLSLGRGVVVGYHAQDQSEVLDTEATVLEEMRRSLPYGWSEQRLRTLLGRFLFSGDAVHKRIGTLSGGEKSRLSLARLLLVPCNLLLLDEPTNHLDVPSREALEAALRVFPGTVVVASHDRYFLEQVVDRVGALEDGRLTITLGRYSTWAEARAAAAAAEPTPAANGRAGRLAPPRSPVASAEPGLGPGPNGGSAESSRRGRVKRGPNPLTAVEAEIAALVARREEVEAALANPDGDREALAALGREYADLDRLIAEQEARWEALVEAGHG